MQNLPEAGEMDGDRDLAHARSEYSPKRVARGIVSRVWNPQAISPPKIAPDLHELSWIERSAEVTIHAVLCAEYWLRKGGGLREWFRLSLWAALILTALAVLVIPAANAFLAGVKDMTALLSISVSNVIDGASKLPSVALGVAAVFLAVKFFQRHKVREKRRGGMMRDDYDSY